MNKIFLSLSVLFSLYGTAFCQAPSWAWAKSAGGASQDDAFKVGTDAAGNVYVAGNYSGSITWGTTTLSGGSIYVAKFDSLGNVLWAKSASGNTTSGVYGMATDASGNTYIGGYFDGASITFGSTTLHNSATWHSYLAKYDASGNVAWAVDGGGNGNQVQAIAVDCNHVFICGIYQNTTCTIGSTTLTSDGDNDSYIAELDANGNGIWATRVAGTSWDDVYGISTDGSGNSYISGYSGSSSLSFGTAITLSNTQYSVFVAKFNSNGTAVWAKNTTGSGYNFVSAMATDRNGNTYITGYVDGTTNYGNSISLSSSGAEYFLAKYDANGNTAWAKTTTNATNGVGNDVVTDALGNIYATGYFQGSSATFGSTTLTSSESQTCFLAKYDPTGNVSFALNPVGNSNDNGEGIAIDVNGGILLSGTFLSSSITFGSTTLSNNGNWDAFIARTHSQTVNSSGGGGGTLPLITVNGATTFCHGDSVILTSSAASSYFWSDSATTQSITVKNSGSYSVMVSAGSGCNATSVPTVVTVLPPAHAGVITGADSICSGSQVNLTASGTQPQNWQWQSSPTPGNFTNINSATDSVYGSQVSQTTYYRVYAGTGNCSDTSAVFKVTANPLPAPVVSATDSLICSTDSSLINSSGSYVSYHWSDGDTLSSTYTKVAGAYWVTVTDANGCSAVSGQVNISVYPVPSISIIVQGDTLTSFGAISYQWYFNDTAINGATSAIYVANRFGNYSVQVTDSNGCKATSNDKYISITGWQYIVDDKALNVYPNPFADFLNIQSMAPVKEIKVYDVIGNLVFSHQPVQSFSGVEKLNVAILPPGIYFVKVRLEEGGLVRKMVKQQ